MMNDFDDYGNFIRDRKSGISSSFRNKFSPGRSFRPPRYGNMHQCPCGPYGPDSYGYRPTSGTYYHQMPYQREEFPQDEVPYYFLPVVCFPQNRMQNPMNTPHYYEHRKKSPEYVYCPAKSKSMIDISGVNYGEIGENTSANYQQLKNDFENSYKTYQNHLKEYMEYKNLTKNTTQDFSKIYETCKSSDSTDSSSLEEIPKTKQHNHHITGNISEAIHPRKRKSANLAKHKVKSHCNLDCSPIKIPQFSVGVQTTSQKSSHKSQNTQTTIKDITRTLIMLPNDELGTNTSEGLSKIEQTESQVKVEKEKIETMPLEQNLRCPSLLPFESKNISSNLSPSSMTSNRFTRAPTRTNKRMVFSTVHHK